MLAEVGPPGLVLAEEPVEVVVPAVASGLESVCDEPAAEVEVDADPAPVELGVGVCVPAGLCELDWLLPSPDEVCPEVLVPAPVDAVPDPEPCAAEPELPGLAWVSEPVAVEAAPVVGVEPAFEPPASACAVLPVEAEADEPPVPPVVLVVEVVDVVALAAPPVEVGVGAGVGVGVGAGVGVGVGAGVGVGVGAGVDPDWCAGVGAGV